MEVSAAGSVAQSQALVQGQVAVSVLKKSLDITAEQGAELAKILANSAGVGQRVDQYA
ncbi:YjfB family protein [Geothrix sp. PMB-07]|uniref:YjfB family protein n=1 Tax=Geothrix sp. PMB-07 TaxID=3068640 RepID=UPI0027425781|nr:YjfB family protein [Geothrix sp. PMB-07]WLT31574.1 YjfB family protein [Geothrix sp. PMB-07]